MLMVCMSDGQIKRVCASRWDCDTRSVERYLRRARERNLAETSFTSVELRSDQMLRYLRLAQSQEVSDIIRLRALERIDKIHGLEVHQHSVHVHPRSDGASGRGAIEDLKRDPEFVEYLRQKSAGDDAQMCSNVQGVHDVCGEPGTDGGGDSGDAGEI